MINWSLPRISWRGIIISGPAELSSFKMRNDGRQNNQLRHIKIIRNYLKHPEGSVYIETGDTKVICTASVEESVPPHRKGSGLGWVTAEYGMLPRSTNTRMRRESSAGKLQGRTQEIQRLIGRAMRCVTAMDLLGERTILLDADVIQADGGTRIAAINGCFIAMYDAVKRLMGEQKIKINPITEFLGAASVGVVNGQVMLDLNYEEDSSAEVDMNVVMTESGKFVEVQGTAEGKAFPKEVLEKMLDEAQNGINKIIKMQKDSLS